MQIAKVFDLDETSVPIACASLGQVYRCRHRETGEVVAVKVQRPDVDSQVALDLHVVVQLATAAAAVRRRLTAQAGFDEQLMEAFAGGSYAELDYVREADAQERFRSALTASDSPTRVPGVVVPRVLTRFLTYRTIQMLVQFPQFSTITLCYNLTG